MEPLFEHCEFNEWYPLFHELTPKTKVLTAPESFRTYLLSDGIALHDAGGESSSEWESDVPPKNAEDAAKNISHAPPLDFHNEIASAITSLNGEVAPKLNWSAPVDAKWILPSNTMRCTTPNDIYLLLKSSDYVNHDLQLNPRRISLVLREWFDLNPAHEFRCFVHRKTLVGICQRDMNFYNFLEPSKSQIESACGKLSSEIKGKYPDESFVFDVYISKSFAKAWLIDINPWHEKTDSILFTWEELSELGTLEIRLIDKEDRTRAFNSKPHSSSQVPYEFVDMQQGTLQDMLQQMKDQKNRESNE